MPVAGLREGESLGHKIGRVLPHIGPANSSKGIFRRSGHRFATENAAKQNMKTRAHSDSTKSECALRSGRSGTRNVYLRLPQKRWMRRQASSRFSVFVA